MEDRIRALEDRIRALEDRFSKPTKDGVEIRIRAFLENNPGACTLKTIMFSVGCSKPTAIRCLHNLVQGGVVIRHDISKIDVRYSFKSL